MGVDKCFMGVSWMFQGWFKHVLKKLQGYFKSAWKESFKCVPRKFPKCPKQVSRLFQGNFNNVSKVFQSSFKGVLRKFCCCIALIAATRAEGGLV